MLCPPTSLTIQADSMSSCRYAPSELFSPMAHRTIADAERRGITAELSSQPNGQLAAGTTLALPAQLAKAEPISTTFAVAGKTRMFSLLAATSTVSSSLLHRCRARLNDGHRSQFGACASRARA